MDLTELVIRFRFVHFWNMMHFEHTIRPNQLSSWNFPQHWFVIRFQTDSSDYLTVSPHTIASLRFHAHCIVGRKKLGIHKNVVLINFKFLLWPRVTILDTSVNKRGLVCWVRFRRGSVRGIATEGGDDCNKWGELSCRKREEMMSSSISLIVPVWGDTFINEVLVCSVWVLCLSSGEDFIGQRRD